MMILAGDIGGTKIHLALFAERKGRLLIVGERKVATREYAGLEAVLQEFPGTTRVRLDAACFGIAGPIVDGRCAPLNFPWTVEVRRLQQVLKLRRVMLLNDLEALAYGVGTLPSSACVRLNAGHAQPRAPIAVIAAGTGLGEGSLVWNGACYQAISSEGGHAEFGPRTPLEAELWQYARGRFSHVSYERVVSGPGKVLIYEFLRDTGRGVEPAWLRRQFLGADQSAVISARALDGRSALCKKALALFVSIYGAEAGNLALKVLAQGGVYLGGGIAPTILPALRDGTFMRAFTEKGRLSPLMARIPVRVIMEPRVGLYGAAHMAARMVQKSGTHQHR